MMGSADEVIVVADASKFGRRGLAQLGGWEKVDRVVSDDSLDPKWQAVIREAGAEVVLASTAELANGRNGNGGGAR